MIANKTNQMSFEMTLDSAIQWPTDQSFFSSNDWSAVESLASQQSPQLMTADDQWIQEFEVFKGLCDGIDCDLNYEPEATLEAMTKEVVSQSQTRVDEYVDYLDSTAFLSPESLSPLSPNDTCDGFETLDLVAQDLNSTSAMTILEEILSSANNTDNDDCFDSELDVQSITEITKDSQTVDNPSVETSTSRRRQPKRKAVDNECVAEKVVANKRRRSTVLEKKERKRSQNKSAANRYRIKKRAEMESIDELVESFNTTNVELRAQLQKLQMEFKVVLPLAKAAFATDANKALQLQMLDIRVLNDNLLD